EDGIRAFHVTGVQTCALPICRLREIAVDRRLSGDRHEHGFHGSASFRDICMAHIYPGYPEWTPFAAFFRTPAGAPAARFPGRARSEERRGGNEGTSQRTANSE